MRKANFFLCLACCGVSLNTILFHLLSAFEFGKIGPRLNHRLHEFWSASPPSENPDTDKQTAFTSPSFRGTTPVMSNGSILQGQDSQEPNPVNSKFGQRLYNEYQKNMSVMYSKGRGAWTMKADAVCGANPLTYISMVSPPFQVNAPRARSTKCVITAFDQSHERQAMQMILSMVSSCRRSRLLVYDFGMTRKTKDLLRTGNILELLEPPAVMPDYARSFERYNKGFKPLIVADAISRGCRIAFWADASTRSNGICVDGDLEDEFTISLSHGVTSNREFTHPGMYAFFSTARSSDIGEQFQSGNIRFNASFPLWNDILCRWLYCCMHRQCVLPDGAMIRGDSSEKVVDGLPYRLHRDDQSAFNLAILDTVAYRKITSNFNFLDSKVLSHVETQASGEEEKELKNVLHTLGMLQQRQTSQLPKRTNRFIVLSASMTSVVHDTPYSLLLPLTARSWAAAGFRPVIVLVVHAPEQWKKSLLGVRLVEELKKIPGLILFFLPSPTIFVEVSLSQVSRLFVSFLLPDSELNSYLRVSDADMIIYQGWPFRTENLPGVHIFNGDCCLPQRPMHSIGMNVRLWRELFSTVLPLPNGTCSPKELSEHLTVWLSKQGVDIKKLIPWAQREWSIDQDLAGQIINSMDKHIMLTTTPFIGRVHYPQDPLIRDVVESHEHKISVPQLLDLQKRIDSSTLRHNFLFQNWSWTAWIQTTQQLHREQTEPNDTQLSKTHSLELVCVTSIVTAFVLSQSNA